MTTIRIPTTRGIKGNLSVRLLFGHTNTHESHNYMYMTSSGLIQNKSIPWVEVRKETKSYKKSSRVTHLELREKSTNTPNLHPPCAHHKLLYTYTWPSPHASLIQNNQAVKLWSSKSQLHTLLHNHRINTTHKLVTKHSSSEEAMII